MKRRPRADLNRIYLQELWLNGDGKPEIVTVVAGKLTVFLNTTPGAGSTPSFATRVDFAGLVSSASVFQDAAVADFTGDGKPDVAIITEPAMSVFPNQTATGSQPITLGTRVDFLLNTTTGGIAAADYNGDSKPDIAVTVADGTVAVFVNMQP